MKTFEEIDSELGDRSRRFEIWHDGGEWIVSLNGNTNQSKTLRELICKKMLPTEKEIYDASEIEIKEYVDDGEGGIYLNSSFEEKRDSFIKGALWLLNRMKKTK